MRSAVKTGSGKFGDVLDRVEEPLDTASRSIDRTGARSRAIERRLRSVEELPPENDPAALPGLSAAGEADGGEEPVERPVRPFPDPFPGSISIHGEDEGLLRICARPDFAPRRRQVDAGQPRFDRRRWASW